VAAQSDGPSVATGSYSGMIAVYDTSTETWTKVLRPTTAGISSLHYDARRSLFLASSYDGTVYEVGA
jgi:WD40 repeat protein